MKRAVKVTEADIATRLSNAQADAPPVKQRSQVKRRTPDERAADGYNPWLPFPKAHRVMASAQRSHTQVFDPRGSNYRTTNRFDDLEPMRVRKLRYRAGVRHWHVRDGHAVSCIEGH